MYESNDIVNECEHIKNANHDFNVIDDIIDVQIHWNSEHREQNGLYEVIACSDEDKNKERKTVSKDVEAQVEMNNMVYTKKVPCYKKVDNVMEKKHEIDEFKFRASNDEDEDDATSVTSGTSSDSFEKKGKRRIKIK